MTEMALLRPSDVSVVPSIGSTAMSQAGPPAPISSPLNSIGRFVLLALADHDDALHRDRVEDDAHRVDRGTVGAVLVALAEPAPGGQRRGLGDPGELHGQVAIGGLSLRVPCGGAYLAGAWTNCLLRGGPGRGRVHARRRGPGAARRGARGGGGRVRCSRSGRTAASRPSTSAPRRARAAPSSTPSTTTGGRRRTRRAGSTTTSGSSTRAPGAWTRSRSSAARSRTPGSRTSSSRSSARRRRSPRTGRRRSGSCSSTAATPSTSRSPTTRAGRATSRPAALLVFHDVFEDPADGGQAPYEVWQHAVADGFTPASRPPAASASCARP